MPARADPSAKVKLMVLSTGMPISWAASGSSETARMALPMEVLRTSSVRAIMVTAVTTRVSSAVPERATLGPSCTSGRSR